MHNLKLHLLILLISLVTVGQVVSDEFLDEKKDKSSRVIKNDDKVSPRQVDKSDKLKVIRAFFEDQGIFIGDEPSAEFVDQYDEEVVAKMYEVLEKDDFLTVNAKAAKVNSLIFSKMLKRKDIKAEFPYELADEALFRALDLIVPNSPSEPELELAKRDLRKFFEEQNELGHELLDRISYLLDAEELRTHKAVEFLLSSYYNWIPLGRLGEYIDKTGE